MCSPTMEFEFGIFTLRLVVFVVEELHVSGKTVLAATVPTNAVSIEVLVRQPQCARNESVYQQVWPQVPTSEETDMCPA